MPACQRHSVFSPPSPSPIHPLQRPDVSAYVSGAHSRIRSCSAVTYFKQVRFGCSRVFTAICSINFLTFTSKQESLILQAIKYI